MSEPFEKQARNTAERVARESYGKLVSILAARNRDIAAAEDALSGAFQSAMKTWPQSGVPERPEAWLLTAARRNLLHQYRHQTVRTAADYSITLLTEERSMENEERLVDKRLELMFVCTHPAIDASDAADRIGDRRRPDCGNVSHGACRHEPEAGSGKIKDT